MSEVKTDDQMKEEIRNQVEQEPEQQAGEEKTIEEQAAELGWHPEGKNKFGETVSAERYIQEKPLYDTIGKLKSTLGKLDEKVDDLIADNRKIAEYSMKEKETLLEQLKVAKENALTNFEADEVRNIDKKIDSVKEEIAVAAKQEYVSPHYASFLEDNEWAANDDDIRTIAAEGIGRRFIALNPNAGDKAMYNHIQEEIKKQFPEKFEEKKPSQKVASTTKRVPTNNSKTKKVTLADLDPEEARLVRNMMAATGKTEEEYMKNYVL